MAKPRMDLSAFVGKLLEEQDVLREGIRVLSQALMESEVAGLIRADRHERTPERTGHRNGYRMRTWDTRVGTIELAIPKVRPGTYFPSLLQPRRRAEHALLAVVQEAYVHGVSTRKVDELMKALGLDGVSKSEMSRICGELDPLVDAFRTRTLTTEYPYIWVDATYHKVRVNGRVTSQATVVAVGVTTEGERQVLGIDVGPSEDRAFWTAFLRSLVKRGLRGVRLITSDAHEGLKQAIATVLSGATWQRCRVHFMRNLLATVPRGAREAIAAVVRTIFAQPDHATAMTQLRKVADGLCGRFAQAAALLQDAAEDILAYRHLPLEHQRQLHSTNPLERLNKDMKRRSNVVGIFPTPQSVIRLVGAILLEPDDEWAVAERRYFSAESMKQLTVPRCRPRRRRSLRRVRRSESVWALVENPLCGLPSSGGRCSSVHGGGSVHAVVELRKACATYTTTKKPASGGGQRHLKAEGLQPLGESFRSSGAIVPVEVLDAEVAIGHLVAQHEVHGREQRRGNSDNRLLWTPFRFQTLKLRMGIGVPSPDGGPGCLDKHRFEPWSAVAHSRRSALACTLIKAWTQADPRS